MQRPRPGAYWPKLNNCFPKFLPEDTEILGLQVEFKQEFAGLKIRGFVDRLDRRQEGLVLINYKSGGTISKGIKDHEGKAKIDLQLTIYKMVGAAGLYPGELVAQTIYYSIGKAKNISPKKVISETELGEVLKGFKQHFQNGSYPVAPDQDREACKYCDYDWVCRQGKHLKRKGL